MSDLTAVDILIEPDKASIERARDVNRRMPLSIAAGITLDDTHLPHITMLQRYLITATIEQAYAAIGQTLAATDPASLSYHVAGITYSEHWGPPRARPPQSWACSPTSGSWTCRPPSSPPSPRTPGLGAPTRRSSPTPDRASARPPRTGSRRTSPARAAPTTPRT